MPLSRNDLRAMVAAASTIPERLSSHILPGSEQTNDEVLRARLRAWCQVATGGDWQRFQERLSWDGLDLAGAQRLFAQGYWHEHVPLPEWTTTLQETLHLLETIPGESAITAKGQWPFLDASTPLPFEELLAPFVSLARRRFLEQAETAAGLLTDAAHLTLQRHLLQVLTSLSVPTLHAEFAQSRAQAAGSNEQRDDREFYRHFLKQMCQGGLAALLRTYSVLARLLATTCDLWVEANVEFAQRLRADWPDLAEMFGAGGALGQVAEIQPALSDAHAGRRSVMALNFASGCRLIYKPRAVGVEEAYYRLLNWCNVQGASPPLQILKVLNRVSYGWMELAAYEPCQNLEALRRYYQRAGMVLCLVYVLGGMNCFYDQFIAHGEQPVLVDASHLLHPYPSPDPQHRQGEDWEQTVYSVLHTGLLTSWPMPATSARISDVSGLGLCQQFNGRTPDIRQELPSLLKYGSLKPRVPLNVVACARDDEQTREEYLHDNLSKGFQHMYQLLLRQRVSLLAPGSPLQIFKTQTVRIAYRDRAFYDSLFPNLLAPQALHDAVTRSMFLEQAGLDCVPIEWFRMGKRDHARWWAIFAAERQALLQGDIPVVSAYADRDALLVPPDQAVESYLCRPSFDLLLKRIEQLSDEDMLQQRALLERVLSQKATRVAASQRAAEERGAADEPPDVNVLLGKALAIADDISRHSVQIGQDSIVWVNASASLRFRRCQLQPMRYGFSDGVSGIAFFLAALAKCTGIASYRGLARAALRPLHRLLREEGARLVCEMGLGGGPGLGSVVYALTRASQFLNEPGLLTDARAAASLITPQLIADDELLDVYLGSAGALLGLLALYEVSPEQQVLDQAIWCGQHLLRMRTMSNATCRAWPTIGKAHTTGFAHGTAGIAYALLRLYALTGDSTFFEAAQEGLRYEDRALVRERGNWAEEVGKEEAEFGISWCHGAPGIGLARIGGLPMLDTASIRQDIEIALQMTQQIGFAGVDHLCCGTCGRAEILLTAARRLARPELAEVAARYVGQVLTRAEQRGAFVLNPLLPRWVSHPQLFQGASGIGYTLLRLAHPDALPSLLLWE